MLGGEKGRPLLGLMSGAGAVDRAKIWGKVLGEAETLKADLKRRLSLTQEFFLFLPLDASHGRSNFSVWASILKEHDLDPAPHRDTSERSRDWCFVPKGSRVSVWFEGHSLVWTWMWLKRKSPLHLVSCSVECASVESSVSLAVCHITDKPLTALW